MGIFESVNLIKQVSMAYLASKRMSYWGQFGVLAGFTGAGLILGGFISLIPIIPKIDLGSLKSLSTKELIDSLLAPENANALRWMQFLSTLFLFFIPAIIYGAICHKQPFTHLGLKKKVTVPQIIIVIAIMVATLPLSASLSKITELLPFSPAMVAKMKAAEEAYNKQVMVLGRMHDFKDYLISLFMLAILPAIFEETLFRGGLQNLFSRWWKMPILSIIITSIVFSYVHGSYLGFLSRAVLGFVLGWMYYRTGNLWLSITAHATNNAIAVTALYLMRGKNPDTDVHFPFFLGLISVAAVYGLFLIFERVSKYQVDRPGQEVLIPVENSSQPSWVTDAEQKNNQA
jgi:membrane protease YdiL (CAAX protease family)